MKSELHVLEDSEEVVYLSGDSNMRQLWGHHYLKRGKTKPLGMSAKVLPSSLVMEVRDVLLGDIILLPCRRFGRVTHKRATAAAELLDVRTGTKYIRPRDELVTVLARDAEVSKPELNLIWEAKEKTWGLLRVGSTALRYNLAKTNGHPYWLVNIRNEDHSTDLWMTDLDDVIDFMETYAKGLQIA